MKKIIILTCIMILAAVLRFWQLGLVPPSPDWDEAALGYNAYSLLQTGKDEYGTRWPLALRSFDDYKPPLYVYLAMPSIKAFGLSTFSVRVPAAVMGTLGVLGTYFLVIEIIGLLLRSKKKALVAYSENIPLITMFLLAISPWHLQFSRIAFEANIGVTINIWGVYLLLKSFKHGIWMPISAILFGLGFYAYHSERVFIPLLLVLVFTLFYKEFFSKWKYLLVSIVVGSIIVGPLVPVVFGNNGLTRLKGTSSLSDQTGLLSHSVSKLEDDMKRKDMLGTIWENRRLVYIKTIADGYLSHFSLKWLFLTGDNGRHHAPDTGLLYLWELPFLLWGMVAVIRAGGAMRILLFGWLLIAPIAASPTSETPHAIRTLVTLPIIQIFIAFGIYSAYIFVLDMLKRVRIQMRIVLSAVLVFYCIVALFNIGFYLHMYHSHMNIEYSKYWQYGYEQAVSFTEAHKKEYKKIVVSTKLEQPHMFYLFFTKYDPAAYLASGGTESGGFAEVRNKFDIYEFRPIHWENELHDGTILYVGTPTELPEKSVQRISYLNGEEAIRIAQ